MPKFLIAYGLKDGGDWLTYSFTASSMPEARLKAHRKIMTNRYGYDTSAEYYPLYQYDAKGKPKELGWLENPISPYSAFVWHKEGTSERDNRIFDTKTGKLLGLYNPDMPKPKPTVKSTWKPTKGQTEYKLHGILTSGVKDTKVSVTATSLSDLYSKEIAAYEHHRTSKRWGMDISIGRKKIAMLQHSECTTSKSQPLWVWSPKSDDKAHYKSI